MLLDRRHRLRSPLCMLVAGAAAATSFLSIAIVADAQRADSSVSSRFTVVEATIDDVLAALMARRISCRDLTELYLERIGAYDQKGPALNAVQTVNPHAIQEADRLDRAFATAGPVGPLHCVSVLVKDQLDTNDIPTTHGLLGSSDSFRRPMRPL
jgi:amidase